MYYSVDAVFKRAKVFGLEPVALQYVAGSADSATMRVGSPMTRPCWKVIGRYPRTFPCSKATKYEVLDVVETWASMKYNVDKWRRLTGYLPETLFSAILVDTLSSADAQPSSDERIYFP